MKFYNEAGHVCPVTQRIAVPASEYAKSHMNGDISVFLYQKDPEHAKNDPWKVVAKIKHEPEEDTADILFHDGHASHVKALRNIVVYLPKTEYPIER